MTDEQIRRLLYAGEETVASLSVADGTVVATSHRLLVSTPDGGGPNLRVVQGPNVLAVGYQTRGDRETARSAVYAVALGIGSLLLGSVFDLGGAGSAAPSDTDALGVGGLLDAAGLVLSLLGFLDDALVLAGVVAVLLGLGLVGLYVASREPEVVVTVAGDEQLRVSAGPTDEQSTRAFAEAAAVEFEQSGLL